MDFGKIGVIFGGPSEEHDISVCTGRAIVDSLRKNGHDVVEIGETGPIEEGVVNSGMNIAFIALHGRYGEDGTVQKYLENMDIPYTGSDPVSSSCAFDKILSKKVFLENNISVPDYFVTDINESNLLHVVKGRFSFPVVLKPSSSGSSLGLSIVNKTDELHNAVIEAGKYGKEILVEQYIEGKEITVGILGEAPLPVIQIVPKSGYYDYRAKYTKDMTDYIVPAKLSAEVYRRVQNIGLAAHRALGCRDFSRVDLRLDRNGKPWVLEVNTIPGFTQTSLLPKAAKSAGIEFDDLCERILTMAWDRQTAGV